MTLDKVVRQRFVRSPCKDITFYPSANVRELIRRWREKVGRYLAVKCEGDSGHELPAVLIARYAPAPSSRDSQDGGRNFDRVTYSIAKQPHVYERAPWSSCRRKTIAGILLTEMVQAVPQLGILILYLRCFHKIPTSIWDLIEILFELLYCFIITSLNKIHINC